MQNIEDIYELSHTQQGMLFHTLYAPEFGVYVEQLSCLLRGQLDVPAFQRAWQQVVNRHPVFRTSFLWEDLEKPVQIIHSQVELPWTLLDWRAFGPDARAAELEVFLEADRQQGFNLEHPPLMRCALMQEADDAYRFVWSSHHLLMDGWSLPIVLKDVFTLYDNLAKEPCEGLKPSQGLLASPPRPYRDYIAWLQQQDLTSAEAFWRKTLQGFTAPTPLVVDRRSAPSQGPITPQSERFYLPEEVTANLQTFAQQHHITLNTLIQGTWAILLSRYSGETDIVFGMTVSGRPTDLSGADTMVGLFINTLPVRVQVPPDAIPIPWMQTLQAQQTDLRQYEHSPLVQIQGWSDVPRDTPLFESIVAFENYPVDASLQDISADLDIEDIRMLERTNYALTVGIIPGTELLLQINYDASRFEAATIQRMLGHIQTLLTGIAADNGCRICELPLLTDAERYQILVEWNDTAADYPRDKCIHELFEEQVERTPDAVAVVFAGHPCESENTLAKVKGTQVPHLRKVLDQGSSLTYHELNARANQLARYLQKLGVGPEVLVGICVERSLEMIVGLLGILKAGGAYVPLDPTYPQERLAFMLTDTNVPVLLTQNRLLSNLPAYQGKLICLDTDWEIIGHESPENFSSGVTPENLAYVIYTSGSTGNPKGVMIRHNSVVNLSVGLQQAIYSHYQDTQLRVSLNGSLSFDTSVKQIIQLLQGHLLEILPKEIRFDGNALVSYLRNRQIDVFDCTPSQLQLLLSVGLLTSIESFPRIILIGGEAIDESLWMTLMQAEQIDFYNVYGPTEYTVDTTICKLQKKFTKPIIGRPIPNTETYIFNRYLQPLPVGVAGELHLSGIGLARGYLNRPDLTNEKFIAHPFSDRSGARLYKTGDLARYLPDGNLEFLGRCDHQIKIRGFRIELGEIEFALNQHHNIREAVVVIHEAHLYDKRLVAYIVAAKNTSQKAISKELREYLMQMLPEYMIPAMFVMLKQLPLTTNGKIDRNALPIPEKSQYLHKNAIVTPRNALERELVVIWTEVLGVEQVGIHDNFFDLGGHSLLAMRLLVKIQQHFQRKFSLSMLFEAPTIAQLARLLQQQDASGTFTPLVPIQAQGEALPFYCVHPGDGNIFCYYELAQHLGTGQPFYGLQTFGLEPETSPLSTVQKMASAYLEAMRSVSPEGPYLLGGFCTGGIVAYEMAQQLIEQGEEVSLLILMDTQAPHLYAPFGDDVHTFMAFGHDLGGLMGIDIIPLYQKIRGIAPTEGIEGIRQDIQELSQQERLHILIECAKQAGKWSPEMDVDFLQRIFRVYRAGAASAHSYTPHPYAGWIVFVHALDGPGKTLPDRTLGWAQYASHLDVYDIPGDHFAMLRPPYVQELAHILHEVLPGSNLRKV